MEISTFPKLKTIAAFIIGSCVIASLFHQHYLLPSTVVDQSPTVLEKASPSNNTPAVYPWLRSSAVLDQLPTQLQKVSPNDDTAATYPWLRPKPAAVNRSPTWERASPDDETSAVYPWARRHIRAHARVPEPSKETVLFWHIPKVRYDSEIVRFLHERELFRDGSSTLQSCIIIILLFRAEDQLPNPSTNASVKRSALHRSRPK